MENNFNILVINPGSTSTKIALFRNEEKVMEEVIRYSEEQLAPYATVMDQYEFRRQDILEVLKAKAVGAERAGCGGRPGRFVAPIGRGNL
jgi:butyrate kinase